jgi:predicted GIY-YIG superfamily endonuclease
VSGSACVYRMFNAAGDLLYIGCTTRPAHRFTDHQGKPWFSTVATVTIEHFDDFDVAYCAEQTAIAAESPPYNGNAGSGAKSWATRRRRMAERKAGAS